MGNWPAHDCRIAPILAGMITVHHLETSRSQRVLWLLEELGLPYEIVRYQRDPKSRLAPPELKAIHPLGKSPVITDGGITVAESGAILEYLAETYGAQAGATLTPRPGTPEHRQCRFWMHYAEGSLMPWLVMKLVFTTIPTQPMPFFVRPVARGICKQVQGKLVDPNLATALDFMDKHLASHAWFSGDQMTLADFQMSFAVEAAMSRADNAASYPHLKAYRDRMVALPAYRRAVEKGGPVVMG
jgi:glutathione S-transferase